jgi:hypothetical protein
LAFQHRGCQHNAELDVSRLPDDVTFNDLQPRMLCTMCDHRGADVSAPWQRHGWSEAVRNESDRAPERSLQ